MIVNVVCVRDRQTVDTKRNRDRDRDTERLRDGKRHIERSTRRGGGEGGGGGEEGGERRRRRGRGKEDIMTVKDRQERG